MEALPKRRKVRKGTQSCWECKRRKIRCTFAAPTESICDGCRSRRTKCVGQEFHDETVLASRSTADISSQNESLAEPPLEPGDGKGHKYKTKRGSTNSELCRAAFSVITSNLDLESQATSTLDQLSSALLAAWPSQHDLDLILSVPFNCSALVHGVVFLPYSIFFARRIASPQQILQLPPRGSHPVILARRLLILGALLQDMPPDSVRKIDSMSSGRSSTMSRVVNAASRLVTSDDELICSLEGIECIMIESMYLNNSGKLQRAWQTNRRAMTIAQMMGLHTGTSSPSMVLEDTRDRIDPDHMWFRLVLTDRYLSLMLGLPPGSHENTFASPKVLETCTALERMERIMSVAAGRILQCNSNERTDFAAAYKVDQMLLEAAALMPPQWWSVAPEFSTIGGTDAKAYEEMIRLTNQFAYHHLLVQLHLPYMMQPPSADTNYDYSKMTAASASRAIIGLFVAFRSSTVATTYCRGIDFIAFIASTTLCIAHVEARRQHKTNNGKGVTVFQSLQHQRPSDRILLERTFEIMKTIAQTDHDPIAQKIISILDPLLTIENSASSWSRYHISASLETDRQGSRCLGDAGASLDALCIQIPCFGTIKITPRADLYDTINPTQILPDEWLRNVSASEETGAIPNISCELFPAPTQRQNKRQRTTTPVENSGSSELSIAQPVNPNWRLVNCDQNFSVVNTAGSQEDNLWPDLTTDMDDWALQGVDMALFNTLARGSTEHSEPAN
ncbi:hypothetical protein F5Y19DRAFT_488933 [Xylariaceae sp. FL1651]|nr:hypothetical protein F5Y19DRAFT_488933 [Xylariaceae sp. FL1651]